MSNSRSLRPMVPTDLFNLKFFQGARLSPDGREVVYQLFTTDAGKDEDRVTLWLLSLETGEARQLTSGQARDMNPAWSADGREVAFVSTRGGRPQLFVIPVGGGEPRALTDTKGGVGGGPVWSPDGKSIAFTAGPNREPRDPSKPYRITRAVYRFDGLGYVDDFAQGLFVSPASGGEARELAPGDYSKGSPEWSPDGQEILFTAFFFLDTVHAPFYAALRVADLRGQVRDLLGDWGFASSAQWTPDGDSVVFVGQPHGRIAGTKSDLWVIGKQGGTPECRTAGLKYGIGGLGLHSDVPSRVTLPRIVFSRDGASAYAPVQVGGAIHIYRVARRGPEKCEPVIAGDRGCVPLDTDGEQVLFSASELMDPMDLHVADMSGAGERRLTCLNAEVLSQIDLPKVEHLLFPGSDGVQVEGWMLLPPSGTPPYPTVLFIHGGPHAGFGHAFYFDWQMLAGAGFAVLAINHRASIGYGDEFSTAIVGDWGHLDYEDLMAGVDYAIAKGLADPDRLGCAGVSGGGNLSCWIVGQTDRFKAAVPENPVTSFVSMYGTSDIGSWFGTKEMGGPPHEAPDVYARCSPITWAHRCKTPTLLVQHENDYRCPAEQSEQFYAVLKANGCTVEMLRIPNSPHGGSSIGRPEVRRAQNEALLDWMNRYVMGGRSVP